MQRIFFNISEFKKIEKSRKEGQAGAQHCSANDTALQRGSAPQHGTAAGSFAVYWNCNANYTALQHGLLAIWRCSATLSDPNCFEAAPQCQCTDPKLLKGILAEFLGVEKAVRKRDFLGVEFRDRKNHRFRG